MIVMRETDLAELYTLLGMYDKSYGGVPEELIGSVKDAYQAACRNGKRETAEITNPRNAGRKSGVRGSRRQDKCILKAAV